MPTLPTKGATLMRVVSSERLGDAGYRITIAANAEARDDFELVLSGVKTENYMRNPVVMWAHDTIGVTDSGGLPVGRTTSLSRGDGDAIVAEFEFLPDDPFADRVRNAWDQGYIRAASISWKPEDVEEVDRGFRINTSDMLEWSIVAIPADPDALRTAHQRMLDHFLQVEPDDPPEPNDEPLTLEQVRAVVRVEMETRDPEPTTYDLGDGHAELMERIRQGAN